jgi:3-oxoadipyl-CoA thiolase
MNATQSIDPRTPVIIDAVRTPIGKYGGVLKSVRPDDMAALVIAELIGRNEFDPSEVDEVMLGCANQAGEDNRNIARMAALLAGLPQSVPAFTINRLCASSLTAIIQAGYQIRSGEAEIIIAGGVESMSRAPYSVPKATGDAVSFGNMTAYDTALGWRYPNPKMKAMFPLESMGETAENLAERYNIARSDQDAFALESHEKAVKAIDSGVMKEEIVAVTIPRRKGDAIVVSNDEQPRRDSSLDKMAGLKPAFRAGGTVTAANSSSLNDGAAAVIVMSYEKAQSLRLEPWARILSSGNAGVDPRVMGIGPVPASQLALKRAGLSIDDIDVIELNEAFAAQSLAVIQDLGIDRTKLNRNGGAIALGHPLGCSGARITTTLLYEMKRSSARTGLATMCIGVGQGVALILENLQH